MAMPMMHFRIIQPRGRQGVTSGNLAYRLGILFEQGIDHLDDLPGDAPHHLEFPGVATSPFVIGAFGFDQTLLEVRPFALVLPNGLSHDKKHHVLHHACPSRRQRGAIQRLARLSDRWCPPKVRVSGWPPRESCGSNQWWR
jgi:hypothetical protein